MIFTFTKHPIVHLLEDYDAIFAVKKVMGVFYDEHNNLSAYLKLGTHLEAFSMNGFEKEIDGFMKGKTNFSWYEESELPFKVQQSGIFQQNLFQEIEKTVLLLRIPAQNDSKYLLFIYLDSDLSHLNLTKNLEHKLTGDMKPILAQFYFNATTGIIQNAELNKQLLTNTFNPNTHIMFNTIEQLKEENNQLKASIKSSIETLIKSLYSKYLGDKISVTLTDSTLDKLTACKATHMEFDKIVKNSVSYIKTIFLDNVPEKITIEEYLINTEFQTDTNTKTDLNRYSKTIQLLDNLNQAIKNVKAQNLNPTGINVGKAMLKPISPPAISDALKNHRNKILTLFKEYPNRWTELRNHFKPIQNLSQNLDSMRRSG